MTAPAITLSGQQSTLALAVNLADVQSFMTEPFAQSVLEAGEVLILENKSFATIDPTIQDIISCDGRNLTDQVIRQWRGAFSIEFFATSRWLAWALAIAWGGASSAGTVAASTAIFTISLTASGGTFRIKFDGQPTDAIAFDAAQAAIQTAVDAVIGTNKLDVARTGTSGPITLTGHAGSTYENAEVRTPSLSTLKLTGGTATIAVTTAGGVARKSYTLSQSTEDQPPAITAVLGYQGSTAWRIWDLVVDSLEVTLDDSGLYRVRMGFVWSGFYNKLASFSWPACSLPKTLKVQDAAVVFGSTDATANTKALTYTFNNRLQPVYATVSKYADAIVRQFPLTNEWNFSVEENPSAAGSIYSQAVASNQDGTREAVTARVGSVGDGVEFSTPEAIVRLNGSAQEFGGTPAYGRVPVFVQALKSDSSATKPVSATAITTYAGGFLAGV